MATKPSLPKGTRDFLPEQMYRRQHAIGVIREVFERYGYEPLETPSLERLEVLSGKYGDEGEKLIFRLLRRGTGLESLLAGEKEFVVRRYEDLVEEALRYDLTVPLSRVVAMHQNELVFPFKRYQIQPVWRADRPQRGRYREFYQCDVDTVGSHSMLADAEAIAIVYDALRSLGFKNFRIRLNNRKILNGILTYAGVPAEQTTDVLIAIDKLEKVGFDGVRRELRGRGLSEVAVKKIFAVLETTGDRERALTELQRAYGEVEELVRGAAELQEVAEGLDALGVPSEAWTVDLFLARGLGYYTGPIHEAVIEEPKIGSLTGGGRYDQLIGMFLGRDIPATGVAFGLERIIDVMGQLNLFPERKTATRVLVTVFDRSTLADTLRYAQALRQKGVPTQSFLEAAKLKKQLAYADRKGIPFVVILGPDEIANQRATLKNLETGEQRTMGWEESLNYLASV